MGDRLRQPRRTSWLSDLFSKQTLIARRVLDRRSGSTISTGMVRVECSCGAFDGQSVLKLSARAMLTCALIIHIPPAETGSTPWRLR